MSTISQEINEPFCDCSNFYANLTTSKWWNVHRQRDIVFIVVEM